MIFKEIALSDSGATVGTPSMMIIFIGLVQSTARYPYPWHLLHLATGPILKIFFLVHLFLLSILMLLSLTSILSGGGRVLTYEAALKVSVLG